MPDVRLDPTLALHAASTWALCGLIWVVQLVQYPLFLRVGPAFRGYHAAYVRRITWVVGPLMAAELVTGLYLWAAPPAGIAPSEAALGLALVALLWLSTALWAVPLHGRLERAFDDATTHRLVRMNWLRTGLWTARGVLVLSWILRAGGAA